MATFPEETSNADDLRPDYDFSTLQGTVRGKYAKHYHERLRTVRLEPDVGASFSDEKSVNDALREYLRNRDTNSSTT